MIHLGKPEREPVEGIAVFGSGINRRSPSAENRQQARNMMGQPPVIGIKEKKDIAFSGKDSKVTGKARSFAFAANYLYGRILAQKGGDSIIA